MRAPLLPLALLVALSGCADGASGEAENRPEAAASGAGSDCIREVASGFKDLFYDQGRVREAYETYVAEDYIQHNPMADDGRDAAIAFLEPIYEANPQHRMTVHRMIVEGPYIVVHLHGQSSPQDLGAAAVDILRVEDCKIVEHWDVTQPVPSQSVNENGMF
jgi:predicted SnoaL-like aldol condensation-catalyzing enzyme